MYVQRSIEGLSHYKMNFRIYLFCLLVTLVCSKELEEQYRRLPNAIAVVGRSFEYFLPPPDGSKQQYKVCSESKCLVLWNKYHLIQWSTNNIEYWHKLKEVLSKRMEDLTLEKLIKNNYIFKILYAWSALVVENAKIRNSKWHKTI